MGPRFRMGRRRGLVVGAAVGAAAANHAGKKASEQQEATENVQAAPASTDTNQQIAELQKLAELKDQGILTQEEFDAKKKQILGL